MLRSFQIIICCRYTFSSATVCCSGSYLRRRLSFASYFIFYHILSFFLKKIFSALNIPWNTCIFWYFTSNFHALALIFFYFFWRLLFYPFLMIIFTTWIEHLFSWSISMQVWQAVLAVRELVLPPSEDIETWIRFASLCRQNGRISQARSTLIKLLKVSFPICWK